MNFNKKNFSFSTPALLDLVKKCFKIIPDVRLKKRKVDISLFDYLMSALAMFHLKYPSLLKFDEDRNEPAVRRNLKNLYGVKNKAPCDTQMRSVLDKVDPKFILSAFPPIINKLMDEGNLDEYLYLDQYLLVSIDGTGAFASSTVSCKSCCTKTDDLGNVVSYYHQLLCAVIVHPDKKQVIPIAAEPIIKEHNKTKNDCERNASKRLLLYLRDTYPNLDIIILEDGLASNAPHLKLLKELDFRYIIGVKEGDHKHLFNQVQEALLDDLAEEQDQVNETGRYQGHRWVNNLPLNKSNPEVKVNFIEYWEADEFETQTKYFTWVTDIKLDKNNVQKMSIGGRTRWKVENETFNTLKNQGYNIEHNYGHGDHHLSTVFVLLILIAFLIDQVQELGFETFQIAKDKFKSRTSLWKKISSLFVSYYIKDWQTLWDSIIYSYKVKTLEPAVIDTS